MSNDLDVVSNGIFCTDFHGTELTCVHVFVSENASTMPCQLELISKRGLETKFQNSIEGLGEDCSGQGPSTIPS